MSTTKGNFIDQGVRTYNSFGIGDVIPMVCTVSLFLALSEVEQQNNMEIRQ